MWRLDFLSKIRMLGLLGLRLVVGFSFFWAHGLDKLRPAGAWDWGQAFVAKMSAMAPEALLYLAAWTEFLAGAAIILGLLTRWASLGICAVMLYAIFKIHGDHPYSLLGVIRDVPVVSSKELAVAYAGAAFALLCCGPGNLSLDRAFFGREATEE